MTDEQSWQSPSGNLNPAHDTVAPAPEAHGSSADDHARLPHNAPPAAAGQAPYGQAPYGQAPYGQAPYGQAPYGQSPYGQAPYGQAPYGQAAYGNQFGGNPQLAAGQAPTWTPPPKPGLIPLRPLGFGTLLGAPFQVLRRNPKATFGTALIIQSLAVVASLLVIGPATFIAIDRMESASFAEREAVTAGSIAMIVIAALIPVLFTVLASALAQGVIVLEVARATLGEKLRLTTLWKAVFRRLLPLFGWILLLSLAYILSIALAVGIVALLATLGTQWIALTITAGVLLGIGLLVFLVWLTIRTSLTPCLIVLEKQGIWAAARRSWALTTGYFWKTLGVQFLVGFIVNVVSQIVLTPISFLYGFAATLIDPNNMLGSIGPAIGAYVLMMLVTLIVGAVAVVAQSATVALIYIDLRMRKEGLDLELQRFVEARELGIPGVEDPYLLPQGAQQPA